MDTFVGFFALKQQHVAPAFGCHMKQHKGVSRLWEQWPCSGTPRCSILLSGISGWSEVSGGLCQDSVSCILSKSTAHDFDENRTTSQSLSLCKAGESGKSIQWSFNKQNKFDSLKLWSEINSKI